MATSSPSIVSEAFADKTLVAEVIPFNLKAIKRSCTLWKWRNTLPEAVTKYLYLRDTLEDKDADPYNQQLNADALTIINNEDKDTNYAGFCLTTTNFELLGSAFGWTLGEGSWTVGQEDRRVSLVARYPRNHSKDVDVPQAFIHIHDRSSMPVVGAVNDNAIYFLENGNWIYLDRHSPRVLLNENYVRVANCVYKIIVPSYDSVSYQLYRHGLDMLFKRAGLAAVHPSLYSLPTKEPFDTVGPYLCHKVIGKTAYGYVETGVNIDSGDPVAIDELGLLSDILDSDREHELEALFAFPDTETLLRANEVRCKKGHVLNSADFYMGTRTTRTFCNCGMVKVYAISKLAQKVTVHDWDQENVQTPVKVMSDSLKGLVIVHDKGWMLRNISGEYIDLISLKPIKAQLSNYKKALKADISCEVDLGPAYLLAPEVSGDGYYSNAVDIYSLAMVFCSIAFPDAYEKYVDYTQPQGSTFKDEMTKCLKGMAYSTPNLRPLANAVKRMLSANPDERPTAAFVLSQIPVEISQMSYCEAKSLADGEPTRKKAKLRNSSGSGSLKYQSTAGSVTSDTKNWDDGVSGLDSSAAPALSATPISDFDYGSEGGWSKVK